MEDSGKIKLSSGLIFVKLLCLFCLGLSVILGQSKSNIDGDFKTEMESKLLFVTSAVFLAYFFTKPSLYYDDTNLYIKKVNKREIAIPFKNIRSIFDNSLSASKGTSTFTIDYIDNSNENDSIKFTADYASYKIKNFINLVKKINPRVTMV